MGKYNYHIHSNRRQLKQTFENIPFPTVYRGVDYGINSSITGKGVKIAILDSGVPDHPDICNLSDNVDMSESERDNKDYHGHSTMVSGILTSNNPYGITGISPDVEILHAKVVNGEGECSYNSLIAATLWAVVKKVDIVLICLGSQTDYSIFHDAVRKAYDSGICILAASGSAGEEYPAAYHEVLSVGRERSNRSGKFSIVPEDGVRMVMTEENMYTTYLHGRYTLASGSSLSAAMGAGLASLIIEKAVEKDGKKPTPNSVYSELSSLSYKPCVR